MVVDFDLLVVYGVMGYLSLFFEDGSQFGFHAGEVFVEKRVDLFGLHGFFVASGFFSVLCKARNGKQSSKNDCFEECIHGLTFG